MSAAQSHHARRTRLTSSVVGLAGLLAIAGVLPLACASNHHISDARPHPIAMQIQNTSGSTILTVFIMHDQGGVSERLGDVPGGKIETFKYTPASLNITYRFAATRGAQPNYNGEGCQQCVLMSRSFNVNDPNTGSVVWDIRGNQVQLYDLPEQQAPAKDTAKAAAPGGL